MNWYDILFFAGCWLCGFLALWRVRTIPPASAAGRPPRAPVSIVIPARNEETALPALLDSLRGQTAPDDEVIVVDDHSEDRTAEIAAGRPGVTLLRAPERHARQNGKSLACDAGARAARRSRLLFVDADVVFLPGALDRIMREYPGEGLLWSVQPYHRLRKLYENFSLFFNIIMMMGQNSFSAFSRLSRPAGAFGPFLLCSRDEYFAVGGHAAVNDAVIEDMALGRLFLKRGVAIRSFAGRGAVEFRMYPDGLRRLAGGWMKNFSLGAVSVQPALFLLILFWIIGAVSAVTRLIEAAPRPASLALAGACFLLSVLQIALFARRVGNFSPLFIVFYPAPLLFFFIIFFFSLFSSFILRRVSWKGRVIDLRKGKKR
ncbi:MAG: glycosyltransferase [Spirochaetales bacterium]|nr:glycosyltransferase [Spirochaetales bacterium]